MKTSKALLNIRFQFGQGLSKSWIDPTGRHWLVAVTIFPELLSLFTILANERGLFLV